MKVDLRTVWLIVCDVALIAAGLAATLATMAQATTTAAAALLAFFGLWWLRVRT